MKILLAIDGSEPSKAAVKEIARQRFPDGSEVRVVSVVETHYLSEGFAGEGTNMDLYVEIERSGHKLAQMVVEKAAKRLGTNEYSDHLRITTEVLSGPPKVAILEDAEVFGADLIVIGSHGYGMVERFLLGSVSLGVAIHAKCSVRIARSPRAKRKAMKVILATDGSRQSKAAVDETVRQIFPEGSQIQVLSVVDPPYMTGSYAWEGVDATLYIEVERIEREQSNAAVEKAAAELRASNESEDLTVTTKVLSGSPKGLILEEAETFGADLIIVGSHGKGMVDRFLLGSVSQSVALHASCSVEIVRVQKSGEKL